MAKYKQFGYGSQGSDVAEKQKLLKENGYKNETNQNAGTASGKNHWYEQNNSKPSNNTTQSTNNAFVYDDFVVSDSTAAADQKRQELEASKPGDFTYADYEKSDIVKQAEALLQQQIANKPGEYQSQWQAQLDETLNKILNREKFSYDLNGDALYQQYKDQYVLQGQQAMMDAMGQAQAMTGGYANSYAQTAGQQTYQAYLQQLNDRVPELYQLALDQYNREGNDLYNQYGLYQDRENQDYGRYRDTLSDYNAELERLTNDARYQAEYDYNQYMDAYNRAYGQHRDNVYDWQQALSRADSDYWNQYSRDYSQYTDNRNLAYQQNRDQVADSQWEQAFKYQQEQDRIAQQQWQAEFDEAVRQYNQQYALANGGSTGSAGGTGSSDAYAKQQELIAAGYDIALDGVWGSQSQAAWDDYQGKVQQASGNPTYRQPTTTGSGATPNGFSALDKNLYAAAQNGASASELNTAITKAQQAGTITAAQAKQLKLQYT